MSGAIINVALVCMWALLFGATGDSEYLAAMAINGFFAVLCAAVDR